MTIEAVFKVYIWNVNIPKHVLDRIFDHIRRLRDVRIYNLFSIVCGPLLELNPRNLKGF